VVEFDLPEGRPRILQAAFAPIPGPVGINGRILDRLPGLVLDYDLDICSLRVGELSHLEKYAGCRVYRVTVHEDDLEEAIDTFRRALQRQIESGDYEIVHFTDPFSGLAALELKKEWAFKTIFEVTKLPSWDYRDLPHLLPKKAKSFLSKLREEEKTCLGKADFVIASSEIMRKLLYERDVKPGRCHLIVGGGELPGFERKKKDDPPLIVFLGRLAPWYDFSTMLAGFAKALQHCKARLAIIGPGDEKIGPKIRAEIAELGLGHCVSLRPAVDQERVMEMLGRASLAVAPFTGSQRIIKGGVVPRKIFEAMAAGLPIIVTETPAMHEIFHTEKPGVRLVPLDDSEAWAESFRELIADPKLCEELGKDILRLHRASFSNDAATIKLRRLYAAILQGENVDLDKALPQVQSDLSAKNLETNKRFFDMPDAREMEQADITRDISAEWEKAGATPISKVEGLLKTEEATPRPRPSSVIIEDEALKISVGSLADKVSKNLNAPLKKAREEYRKEEKKSAKPPAMQQVDDLLDSDDRIDYSAGERTLKSYSRRKDALRKPGKKNKAPDSGE
jgi:glycosyltransferase involved in cell wall biosynthesis